MIDAAQHQQVSQSSHLRRRSRVQRAVWIAARLPWIAVMAPAAAIGGQAVMDGVMMRGPHSWAVAVRRFDGSIAVKHRELDTFASRHAWARVPIIRGVVALFDALVIGMRALFVSSEYAIEGVEAKFEQEERAREDSIEAGVDPGPRTGEERAELDEVQRAAQLSSATSAMAAPMPLPIDEEDTEPNPDKLGTWAIVVSMIMAMGFSIGLFKVIPVTLVTFLPVDKNAWSFVLIEALIKFGIFCAYLLLVGMMADMNRVFQYHSAEHKTINAWERGVPMEPEAVNGMSRIHVRCGTAFIVWLFLVGVLVFRAAQLTFLQDASRLEIILARPVLLPIIAGVSFELLRFAGMHADNAALRVVLAPGLWFQRLTTRECTPEQCEVAIRSLEAVVEHAEARAAELPAGAVARKDDEYQVLA